MWRSHCLLVSPPPGASRGFPEYPLTGGAAPMTAGNFLGSPQQSPLPGWRWKTWGPGHWGSRPLSFSRVWDQRRPLPTLTVHPDHSFQGADGVEVGFLFPAFF